MRPAPPPRHPPPAPRRLRPAAVPTTLAGMLCWVLLVLGGLVPGCAPPNRMPVTREEPVWSETDFRRRHERMLYHVLEQPGLTRQALERAEQRAFDYDLAAWQAIARRQQRFFAEQQVRKRINTVYFDRLQERIKRDRAARQQRQAEQTEAFLKRMEQLGVTQAPSAGE